MPKEDPIRPGALPQLARFQTASGGARGALPPDAVEFLRRQSSAVRRYHLDPSLRTRPWLNVAIKNANGDDAALTAEIIARVQSDLTEQTLTDAQSILNELSRRPEGAQAIARHLDDATIEAIIRLSGKKG